MPLATRGPVELYYELRGDPAAPPLLLIRGLGRTHEHWLDLATLLERRFRLVLMDNRGVGRSSVPRPPYSTAEMADDAARVLDQARIERAHVFGMSLGGMIAQELALRHPTRVDRLALGCTTAGRRAGHGAPLRSVARLLGAMRFGAERAVAHTAPIVVTPAFLARRPDVLATWQRLARERPLTRRGVLGQLLAASRHDTARRLDRIHAPTLVLSGDADALMPVENSRYLARAIDGAELELLAGSGHDFTTELPDASAALIERFLLG